MYLSQENNCLSRKNTLLKTAASQPTTKVFNRVFFSPPQEKFKNKKSPLQKIKTSFQRSIQTLSDSRASGNKVLPKAGVPAIYETFVLNLTLFFQINGSAETPRLRQYPKRYLQP